MKKLLLAMTALSAIAVAAPASAQYQNQNQNRYSDRGDINGNFAARMDARIGDMQARIEAGVRNGSISRREASSLRQQLRDLTRLERQYRINGFTGAERSALQQRLNSLRQNVRIADGGQGRFNDDRWDEEDRYGGRDRDDWRDNGRGDRIDRDRDGYDDRDRDRDGRWDDDYQAQNGKAGVIDAFRGAGALRIGQRAPDNLYGVPNEYRREFRDGGNSYYRTDGRYIYEIDLRTRAVVRAHPMNR